MPRTTKKVSVNAAVELGDVDPGYEDCVDQLEDIDRGEIAGYNAVVVGNQRLLIPRLGKRDYQNVLLSRLPREEGYVEFLVGQMRHLPAPSKEKLIATKVGVRQPLENGGYRVVVVEKLPEPKSNLELAYEGVPLRVPEDQLDLAELAARRKTKKYALQAVLCDLPVGEKYRIGAKQMEMAKRLAVTDPKAAAVFLQDVMNVAQNDINVTVVPGDYLKDKGQARNALCGICAHYTAKTALVSSEVCGDKLIMLGPDGIDDWHVAGPLKYAREVAYVYWMVYTEGCINPHLLLQLELTILGIDVYDGKTYALPELDYHAGYDGAPYPPVGVSEVAASLLTSEQRIDLQSWGHRLIPVYGAEGSQLATAVRVTDEHLLVNSHVLDADRLCTIGGKSVSLVTQLSRDLWSCRLSGESVAWNLREAQVGESVSIAYVYGGVLSCSPPLTVTSVDDHCVVTNISDGVMARMSGGVLFSLRDLSMLGVHSGSTWNNLIAYKFCSTQLSELLDSLSESGISRQDDPESYATRIYTHFKTRGLGAVFKAAVESLTPVYMGHDHVGMAVRHGDHLYTTCNAEYPLRFGETRAAYVLDTVICGKQYRTKAVGPGSVPTHIRKPKYFEKVFVIGNDGEPYMSNETTVLHVGPNASTFVIGALPGVDRPVQGGLVMGLDGAVLGQCGWISATTPAGLGYLCWSLPKLELSMGLNTRAVLTEKFPFLSMAAWSDELIEEIFTHSSAGEYTVAGKVFNAGMKPLAAVGDAAARAELAGVLRGNSVPHPEWSMEIQGRQSNVKLNGVAWSLGLAQHVRLGPGTALSKDSKVYADVVEALLGAAYLIERRCVFRELCAALEVVPVESLAGDYFVASDEVASQSGDLARSVVLISDG